MGEIHWLQAVVATITTVVGALIAAVIKLMTGAARSEARLEGLESDVSKTQDIFPSLWRSIQATEKSLARIEVRLENTVKNIDDCKGSKND